MFCQILLSNHQIIFTFLVLYNLENFRWI